MKTLLALATLLVSVGLASAQNFLVSLDGAQDGGGARMGTGMGTLTLSGSTLTFNNITFSGLSSGVSIAHIHGPAAAGSAASPIYNLHGTFLPIGVTSGSINGTLTLTVLGSYTVAQQLTDLNNSLWYINIHNASFPGGEIRGQIIPMPVPEPATWALGGMALAALLCWKRRQ